jgi:histone H3/H4
MIKETGMKFFKHKLMVLLALLSLIFQLASPLVIYGEPAMKQKEQIENSIEEYEKTHKEIMALKPIELGSITKWILNRISDLKKGKSNIVNTCKLETPDEKTARDKRERLERYVVQIEKANADLKKVQEKSSQTMKYLRSGNIEKAARTDPTSVYENMDKSTSAVAIYQQALKEAGTSLLQGAEALSETATILGALALLCTGISIGFAPAAAVAAPIATAAEAGAKAAGIGAIALKTAGKTLMGAAEKAIADDQQFVALLSQNTFVAGLEYGMSKAVSKG